MSNAVNLLFIAPIATLISLHNALISLLKSRYLSVMDRKIDR